MTKFHYSDLKHFHYVSSCLACLWSHWGCSRFGSKSFQLFTPWLASDIMLNIYKRGNFSKSHEIWKISTGLGDEHSAILCWAFEFHFQSSSANPRESQNHGTAAVGRYLWRSASPTRSEQRQPELAAQSCPQSGFEDLWGWRTCSPSGQPVLGSATLTMKEYFLSFKLCFNNVELMEQ